MPILNEFTLAQDKALYQGIAALPVQTIAALILFVLLRSQSNRVATVTYLKQVIAP